MASKKKKGEPKKLETVQAEKQTESHFAPHAVMLNLLDELRSDRIYIESILKKYVRVVTGDQF